MVVDGRKGQVSAVLAVLADLGAHDLPVIGLAKPRVEHARGERQAVDKIVVPGVKEAQRLRSNDPALLLLRSRDEVTARLCSFIEGTTEGEAHQRWMGFRCGPRRKTLLTRFGSVQGVRGATVDELAALPVLEALWHR